MGSAGYKSACLSFKCNSNENVYDFFDELFQTVDEWTVCTDEKSSPVLILKILKIFSYF